MSGKAWQTVAEQLHSSVAHGELRDQAGSEVRLQP